MYLNNISLDDNIRNDVERLIQIFGLENTVGLDEVLRILSNNNVEDYSGSRPHVLIPVLPLKGFSSLRELTKTFGYKNFPNFYNQDWYVNEDFYLKRHTVIKLISVPIDVRDSTRGVSPDLIVDRLFSAWELTYIFFVYATLTKEVLWPHDFIWTSDTDNNGDQIYVGRFHDLKGNAKSGFSIHRHLRIRDNYSIL